MSAPLVGAPDRVAVPPPHPGAFTDGIHHPELWLWDSWIAREDGGEDGGKDGSEGGGERLHLYCLALARRTRGGTPTPPADNARPFHYRHFTSDDDGASWRDRGAVLRPANLADDGDSRNVWSGGVHNLGQGEFLFGYTGIRSAGPGRDLVQSVVFATGPESGPARFPDATQSDSLRDRASIVKLGYYLPEAHDIGANEGEGGGPILAWRDPCIVEGADGGADSLHALWSAKVAPSVPAIAHARLHQVDGQWQTELLPPITLPDAQGTGGYTQAEVPKLCRDADTGGWLLLVSACDRLRESQPDSEVSKTLRLYRGAELRGPWYPAYGHRSVVPGTKTLFGASFLDREARGNRVRLLSPRWALAGPERAMTFAPALEVHTR